MGSLTSSMTSDTDTNLSAEFTSFSPPCMMAVASTTATAMPLVDLQLSTNIPSDVAVRPPLGWWWFGGGCCFFTMLLQHGAVGGESGVSSAICERRRETERQRTRAEKTLARTVVLP